MCVCWSVNACVFVLLLGSGKGECSPFPSLQFTFYWGQMEVFGFLLSF